MNIPDKFKFINSANENWEAVKRGNTWDLYVEGKYVNYTWEEDIVNAFEHGTWTMVVEQYNGVNAQGEKLNFTKDDLKPFMRAITQNGNQYIVVPDERHGVALARQLGWMDVCFNEGDANNEGYLIAYVYAAPKHAYQMLDESVTGDLLWKRQESVAEENSEFATRLAYLNTALEGLRERFEEEVKSIENELNVINGKLS